MRKFPTVEDLEDFWEMLQGPMGGLMRQAGVIMARRLDEGQQTWDDLTDMQVMDLFHAAFLEVAPEAYWNRDAGSVEQATNIMFRVAAMELSANADSTDAVN